ncbi:Zn-dependent M28 family amino/carboxypeptidase [Agromyces flavus]|uniref:PA domain-containing protein n=1 Tax=Agromyces flavus TaxID=589382 RepID=A0A1H1TAV7_9MICO|nr:M28 family peptidase [Agromyces flavus]MCP2368460.1 Zn-dependent M28 family amino/carboxypeptidase [Agromyces flavus]GGI47920.1 aminopeptidase [Agromyces flavus]SDS57264.1 PA domain-containing protein [Agromyces flavus]
MYRTARLSRRAAVLATATSAVAALALVPAGAALAAPPVSKCESRSNPTIEMLLSCVSAEGATDHLEALQTIADANGGNRAAGTPGYEASVTYVVDTLKAAGWSVSIDEFPYTYVGPSTLQQLTPVNATYPTGPFTGTGYGTVTAAVTPVDVQLTTPNSNTSGCQPEDFANFPTGSIALVQRGSCNFSIKALNAEAAGAAGVIIFNAGDTTATDRNNLIVGTLGGNDIVDIPVVGASFQQGVALAQTGSTAKIMVPAPESRPQKNIIAEKTGVNDNNVVMAGAHLDSVQAGPGINDNGSGSASLLELAQNLGKFEPQNTIRLAWWGAEESGLIGSTQYVNELSQAEKDRIALYLNFDMVASPNYIFMVYDGDESSWDAPAGVPIPEGSVQIEDFFESYYTWAGEPYEDAQFSGRSDYQAFILNGIPSGGLFTGAEVPKTVEQASIWGGTAGASYDPCYHQACDGIGNVNEDAFDVNVDAIAAAVLAFSYTTEAVNGVVGEEVPGGFTLPAPAGEQGTVGENAGGLDHDHDHEPTDVG